VKSVMSFFAAIAVVTLGQGWAVAQQMPMHDTPMMQTKALEGVVTSVRYVSCEGTPEKCQGIFEVTPGENAMMTQSGGHMMMEHPVTLIVVPGSGLMWQGGAIPLTRLHVGDKVKLEYATVDNMNIVTMLTMTGMAHM